MNPRDRLAAWRKSLSATRETLGQQLDCDGSALGHIEHGRRMPGRKLANAIELHSKSWSEGPILSTDWDELEARESIESIKAVG
jgi:DNA-binding XRE family transcriptional regulator